MRTITTKQIANITITCDFCPKVGICGCWLCDKDICRDCSEIWYEDWNDDYPRRICKNCENMTRSYIKDLELLRENYERNCEDVLTAMRNSVKVECVKS